MGIALHRRIMRQFKNGLRRASRAHQVIRVDGVYVVTTSIWLSTTPACAYGEGIRFRRGSPQPDTGSNTQFERWKVVSVAGAQNAI